MWWQIAFWILLIPLIVVEFIVFLKTRKFSWLIYGMSIFTYVIAVMYTIDVFMLGRNAIIIVLLASAGLMALLGRQLRAPSKNITLKRTVAGILAAAMVLLFVVSVVLGKLQETDIPVKSIKASDLIIQQDAMGREKAAVVSEVKIMDRTFTNSFFLPVPVENHEYRACLITSAGTQNLYAYTRYTENQEVAAGQTKTIPVIVNPTYLGNETPQELLVYDFGKSQQYYSASEVPCAEYDRDPTFRIPVQ